AAVGALVLGLLLGPAPLASTATARVVLRPDSPWSPQRAADLLLSDVILVPASGEPEAKAAAFRSLLRVEIEPSAVRVSSTAFFASTAARRVNAVAAAFAERAPGILRSDLAAELERVKAAIAERSTDLAGLPASRPDPKVEVEAIRGLEREIDRLSAALDKGAVGPPSPLDTRESDRISAEIEAARRRLAELRNTYAEDWPPVAKAAAEIEDLRLRRQQALNRETLEARFAPVRKTIERIRELAAERERRLTALDAQPKSARVAASPEVRRASLQEHLATLEERRAKILTQGGMADVVLERVEPAARASDSRSSLPLLLLFALLAGVAAAWIAERMTSTIRTEHDLRRYVNLPILGVIPKAPDPNDRMVLHAAPDSRLVEPYNTAAALLEGRAGEAGAKLIGITSARPGEGKSTTAANLAISLARGLARVLIVDADLRRPSMHKLMGLGDDVQGLSSYLSGAANQLDSVLAATEMENLTVLPAGSPLQNPIPFLRSERLRVVIPELRERFDFVIVDLPPVRSAADALVLAPTLDGLVLVLGAGETGKDDAAAAKRLIRDARGKLLGCVLTKAEVYSRGYYAYAPATDAS
ncbi:MAG TPA: polysaccharide biosynthesis tyrosine autokinase, partial [Planctomycetota bacterium]